MKILKQDWKFMTPDPDPGFSVERNKRIIADTIRKNDLLMAKRKKKFKEDIEDRVDAITSWAKSMWNSEKPIDRYLGRKWMIRLAGENIMEKIKRLRELREKYPVLRDPKFDNLI